LHSGNWVGAEYCPHALLAVIDDLRRENAMWRSCYLDKPEDRLYHASDDTWWQRKDDLHQGIGGLYRAEPPPAVQKLEEEKNRLGSALVKAAMSIHSILEVSQDREAFVLQGMRAWIKAERIAEAAFEQIQKAIEGYISRSKS
jgi:hypothetical protein